MSNAEIRGQFVWHELMTTDTDAASDFYSSVVPWKAEDSGMPSYTLWMSGKNRAGGLQALPEDDASATPPHWIIYIGTPDVDATVAEVEKLGGKVLKPAADIPDTGRFAVLSDPQGAAFAVFTPAPASGGLPPGGTVGDFTWHELATTDPAAAFEFYSEVFGWTKGAVHDMGETGPYTMVSHGGKDVGGVYKVRDNSTPPNWLSYVRVADAAKAATDAKDAGGRVLHGPMEVPGGSSIVLMLDPQGGAFAVVEAAKAAVSATPAAKTPRKSAKKAPAPAAAESLPAKVAAAAKGAAGKIVEVVKSAAKSAGKKAAKKAAKKAVKKAARKAVVKKVAKKAPAKKAPARKGPAKKAPAKKTAAKAAKRPVGKTVAKAKGKAKSKAKSKAKTKK